jgi:twitching motility protein PilT
VIDKHPTSSAERDEDTAPSATPSDATPELPTRHAEDDFVPADMFQPVAPSPLRNGGTLSPRDAQAVNDADLVPSDIFEPPKPPSVGAAGPYPGLTDSSMAPTAAPGEAGDDDPLPSTRRANGGQPPVQPPETFKPFPMAPPLPPLPLPPSLRPEPTPPVEPNRTVGAAASHSTAAQPARPPKPTPRKGVRPNTADIPAEMDEMLRLAAALGASRLYLSSHTAPTVRIGSVMQPVMGSATLRPSDIERLLVTLALSTLGGARNALDLTEWTFELPDVGTVACTRFRDSRGPGAVFRIVPTYRVSDEPIDLSLDIKMLAVEIEGLVIIAGPRGSGKQAVIDALLGLVSHGRKAYVINVQREAGAPGRDDGVYMSRREARGGLQEIYDVARAALQEDPDVLVLEEVRSAPLMSLAFDAAASGHLIIAGFTAPSAIAAVERIIDLFPVEQARQVQLGLAQHLRGVVGQLQLPKISGGHVAVRELLLNAGAVSAVLASGKVEHLRAAIAAGRPQGMVSLVDALADLVQNGVVAASDAYRHAPEPVAFIDELKRRGLDTSFLKRID